MSRIDSKYSVMRVRSLAPSLFCRLVSWSVTRSRMDRSISMRLRRLARSVLSLAPKSRSNTARGCACTGSGIVSLRHAKAPL